MSSGRFARVPFIGWFVATAIACALLYAGILGVITAIVPNPVFSRSVPPTIWSDVILLASAVLFGPVAASYVLPPAAACPAKIAERSTTAGSILSFIAIGCPVCNKLIVLALGASGAVAYFQPVQPWLGAISLALLAYAAWTRFDLHSRARAGWWTFGRG